MESTQKVDFFLGSHSRDGYVGLQEALARPTCQTVLLKGSPGIEKGKLIEMAAERLPHSSHAEYFHCCLHPEQLDGLFFPNLSLCLLDGSEPHTLPIRHPIASELEFALYDCIDRKSIAFHRERLFSLFASQKQLFRRCQGFMRCVDSLMKDSFSTILPHTNLSKISRAAKRICTKELPKQTAAPLEKSRFLSAITAEGVLHFFHTAAHLCPKIYAIHDEYSCSQRLLLSTIRSHALRTGQEFYSCYCPLKPYEKLDHLLFPKLGVGFVTVHRWNRIPFEAHRNIHFTRFTQIEDYKAQRQKLHFNRKAITELLEEGVNSLQQARAVQSKIDSIYQSAVNQDRLASQKGQLIDLLSSYLPNEQANPSTE